MPADETGELGEEGTLLVEQRFAIVPEWIIDAEISDCAYRLYSVLLRYGQTSGNRMPGRALLARRMHKQSKDTVDRALKELVAIGAVVVERRRRGRECLTNRYHVMTSPPQSRRPAHALDVPPASDGAPQEPAVVDDLGPAVARRAGRWGSGRNGAATPGRTAAATPGRVGPATLAAPIGQYPGVLTEKTPPPAPPRRLEAPKEPDGGHTALHGDDLAALSARCQERRRALGLPTARWSAVRLGEVLREAVEERGWPSAAAPAALLALAADPATKDPRRLVCPGPWWDAADQPDPTIRAGELAAMESRLEETGGSRVWLQQQARADLTARGVPVTRFTVARRACELMDATEFHAC